MQRLLAVVSACLLLAACTTTNSRVAVQDGAKPAAGAQILMLQPDVQLAVLTAAGIEEARADWSQQAQANLAREIETQLKGRAHGLKTIAADTAMDGRSGQLLRLNVAVGQSIQAFSYGSEKLPSKPTGFEWTLGEGAQVLAVEQGADYALFVNARGTYASSGRVVTAIGLAMLGVSVPLGHQQVLASLVDLKTGRVVWFNVATTGQNADMREPAGTASLVTSLLKSIPL
jgi:hypothetical protein